jgi:hypothetical protein
VYSPSTHTLTWSGVKTEIPTRATTGRGTLVLNNSSKRTTMRVRFEGKLERQRGRGNPQDFSSRIVLFSCTRFNEGCVRVKGMQEYTTTSLLAGYRIRADHGEEENCYVLPKLPEVEQDLLCGKKEVENKFSILQLEWYNEGYRYDGGGGGGGPEKLFLFTKP